MSPRIFVKNSQNSPKSFFTLRKKALPACWQKLLLKKPKKALNGVYTKQNNLS